LTYKCTQHGPLNQLREKPNRTFFVLFIIPNRTLTLNQTRTPTFKPTDKNWDEKR
jgi:hypothetical protein